MTTHRNDLELFVRGTHPADVEETIFSHRFCLSYNRDFAAPHPLYFLEESSLLTAGDLLSKAQADVLAIINEPEIIIPPLAYEILPRVLDDGRWSAVVPGYNLSEVPEQRAAMPCPYHNVRNFLEVAAKIWETGTRTIHAAGAAGFWPCIFLKRTALNNVDPQTTLDALWDTLAAQGSTGIVRDILVHRFGNYYESQRTDLIDLIPASAHRILDVGCARGGLGKTLKSKRGCHIAGVEMNPLMADEASKFYDEIYNLPVEDVHFTEPFDAVICGDVIEHLRNPEAVLRRLRDALIPGGALIGSVPNTGHWSIVMDLAQGRFEMIPVGLLCMSHIRFFTEAELRGLLSRAGFEIDLMVTDCPLPTPEGERFIAALLSAGMGNEPSLRTAEFRFRATPLSTDPV